MKKIILDCDPGHDDMVAIILACASDELDILGITTVAGNQTGDKTLLNALKILTLIGEKNIRVAGGFGRPMNGKVSRVVSGLLRFFAETNIKSFGFKGAPLHDPITVACAVEPDIIKTKSYHVDIETKGDYTRGRTVVDVYGVTNKKTNAEVSVSLDLARYKELITGAIKKFD